MLEEICVPREKRSRRRRREGGVIISGTFPRFIAFISNWATDAFDTMPWKSRSASLPAYISLRYTNFFNFPTTFKLDHPRSRETSEKLVFHEILRSLIIRASIIIRIRLLLLYAKNYYKRVLVHSFRGIRYVLRNFKKLILIYILTRDQDKGIFL